jgi:archaellin
LSLASGGGSIDFTPPIPSPDNSGIADPASQNIILISYTDAYQHVDNLYWTLKQSGKSNGNNLLEEDEIFQITVGGSSTPGQNGGNLVNALIKPLSTDTDFEITVQAPQGATLGIDRRTPPYFTNITNFRY